jgi:hypothetical protein
VAGSVAIFLLIIMCQEGLHQVHIDACVDQVMLVLPEEGIRIGAFLFGKFSVANTVVLCLHPREEGVYHLHYLSVVSFCFQAKALLLHIPHTLAVLILFLDVGFKDGHRLISIYFVWPDAASPLSLWYLNSNCSWDSIALRIVSRQKYCGVVS